MPPPNSFTCPHCNTAIAHGTAMPHMQVATAKARDWKVYVLVCPHCDKSLGVYSTPS